MNPCYCKSKPPSLSKAMRIGLPNICWNKRLVACVQIQGPLQSHYHWQGKLESSSEWKCTCKTLPEVWRRVEAAIRSVHPYDVPEILANEVTASEDYLRWVKSEVRTEPTGDQP